MSKDYSLRAAIQNMFQELTEVKSIPSMRSPLPVMRTVHFLSR